MRGLKSLSSSISSTTPSDDPLDSAEMSDETQQKMLNVLNSETQLKRFIEVTEKSIPNLSTKSGESSNRKTHNEKKNKQKKPAIDTL